MKLLLTLLISTMVFVGCSNDSGIQTGTQPGTQPGTPPGTPAGPLTNSEINALKQFNESAYNKDVRPSASDASSIGTLINSEYTSRTINGDTRVDLRPPNRELTEISLNDGSFINRSRLYTDNKDRNMVKLLYISSAEGRSKELWIAEKGFLASENPGNYYINSAYLVLGKGAISYEEIRYVFLLSDNPTVEFKVVDSNTVKEFSISDIDVLSTVKFGETGGKCKYKDVKNDEDGTTLRTYSDCDVAISATNPDDGVTYSYKAQFKDVSQTFNDSKGSPDLKTIYLESDFLNHSGTDVGNFRLYMNRRFLITDNNGNVFL